MRQLRHQRHPLYPAIMGVSDGLIPDEVSAGAPEIVGDKHLKNKRPVQSEYNGNLWSSFNTQDGVCSVPSYLGGNAMNKNPCMLGCCKAHDNCYTKNQCNWSSWIGTDCGIPPILPCWACNDTVVKCIKSCM